MTDTTTEAVAISHEQRLYRATMAALHICATGREAATAGFLGNVYEMLRKTTAERDALEAKLQVATKALSTISVRMELTGDEMQGVALQALTAIKGGE